VKVLIIAAVFSVVFATSGKPQSQKQHRYNRKQSQSNSPVTFIDNSSHITQADQAKEKPPKAEVAIEWANWALVCVGLITFYAVWRQAKAANEATQAMRDSIPLQQKAANAALLNAQAVMNAERAWVIAELKPTVHKRHR